MPSKVHLGETKSVFWRKLFLENNLDGTICFSFMAICMDIYHSANKGTRISCYLDVFEPWEVCIGIQLVKR
jgi:hypothetical protein